eukprot:3810345-Pleurochrysis_carterae.AAC.1
MNRAMGAGVIVVSAGRNNKLSVIALQPSSSVLCLLILEPKTATLMLSAHDPSSRRGDYNLG